jgi:hypothetical protein
VARTRKPRPEPFSEGSIAEIYRLFFGRLIFLKPDAFTIKDWLEHLFDFSNRDIIRYEAEKEFEIPGHFYAAPSVKVQGIGYRTVKPGTELHARTDARRPDSIDVEFQGGQGGAIQVFALSPSEWEWVKLHIREAEKERKK